MNTLVQFFFLMAAAVLPTSALNWLAEKLPGGEKEL